MLKEEIIEGNSTFGFKRTLDHHLTDIKGRSLIRIGPTLNIYSHFLTENEIENVRF